MQTVVNFLFEMLYCMPVDAFWKKKVAFCVISYYTVTCIFAYVSKTHIFSHLRDFLQADFDK